MDLEFFHGSIFDIPNTEAIVIPANKQLSLGWGSHIAEQVKKRGGVGIEQEALQNFPNGIELGDAVLTSGGQLPFSYIIHAAILDKYDFNPLFLLRLRQRTSDQTLQKAVTNSLNLAIQRKLTSLAISPMGGGIGAMPMRKCAKNILQSIWQYPAKDSGLKVTICALKKKDLEIFQQLNPGETLR